VRITEPVDSVPVLERGVTADERPALGAETVGVAVIEFRHEKRLAGDARRHQAARQGGHGGNDGGLGMHPLRSPRFAEEGGVGVIQMVVHHVETGARRHEIGFVMMIHAGHRGLNVELLFGEAGHFRQAAVLELEQEFQKTAVAAVRPGFGAAVLLLPGFEECGVAVAVGDGPVPEGVEVVFVDQVDHHQRGVFGIGEPGIGIAVGHPVSHEFFPVLQRGGVSREERLGHREIAGNSVSLLQRTAGVEVGNQVNAALFECCEKIVEAVEGFRIKRG